MSHARLLALLAGGSVWVTGQSPPSYDKQFVRDYLETLDWDKTPPAPPLPAEVIAKTSAKYREAFVRLTGTDIDRRRAGDLAGRLTWASSSPARVAFSSFNSLTVASIFARLNSFTGNPGRSPNLSVRCGRETNRSGLSRRRSCRRSKRRRCASRPRPCRVVSERTVSTIALAAGRGRKPRALMMAAPRCCTVVMNFPFSQASSVMTSAADGRRFSRCRNQDIAWRNDCPRWPCW